MSRRTSSIRQKLMITMLSLTLGIVLSATIVLVLLAKESVEEIIEINEEHSEKIYTSVKQFSDSTLQRVSDILDINLYDKAAILIEKDSAKVLEFYRSNSKEKLRKFLKTSFLKDKELELALFVEAKGDSLVAWQFLDRNNLKGISQDLYLRDNTWKNKTTTVEIPFVDMHSVQEVGSVTVNEVIHNVDSDNEKNSLSGYQTIAPFQLKSSKAWLIYQFSPTLVASTIAEERELHLIVLKKNEEIKSKTGDLVAEKMTKTRKTTITTLVVFSILITIFIYLISSVISKMLTKPIVTLKDAATAIAEGDYENEVRVRSNDEIGTLAATFETMRIRVKDYAHNLQELVDEKTEDLLVALGRKEEERAKAESISAELEKKNSELKDLQEQYLEAAHRAGMAEVSTGVLHNVGNILNSVCVSIAVLEKQLRDSKVSLVNDTIDLIEPHKGEYDRFLTSDSKGKLIPEFLVGLNVHLKKEQTAKFKELLRLKEASDAIVEVVRNQQEFAKGSFVTITQDVNEVVEVVAQLKRVSLKTHEIELVVVNEREVIQEVDKSRITNALVNLISNSIEAIKESNSVEKKITIDIKSDENMLVLSVSDTGCGLEVKNMTKIFSHGFTTKETGHGFGLHSVSTEIMELGGKIEVSSEGKDQGSKFTIILPKTEKSKKIA